MHCSKLFVPTFDHRAQRRAPSDIAQNPLGDDCALSSLGAQSMEATPKETYKDDEWMDEWMDECIWLVLVAARLEFRSRKRLCKSSLANNAERLSLCSSIDASCIKAVLGFICNCLALASPHRQLRREASRDLEPFHLLSCWNSAWPQASSWQRDWGQTCSTPSETNKDRRVEMHWDEWRSKRIDEWISTQMKIQSDPISWVQSNLAWV